ncbi:MAG: PQQ-binding-like beta-propeller repeat protein [Myxococcota bacterium]|jgi:outer membrane protein assembly factor BamB|nr:PQQ-binding-like beta-propeller repeat protein [Myxococcota bacterium]MBP8972164.1 PQQ-binding-like beta-propeller repeat protein [Myxococcota bacterium]OQC43001.1 MAG: Outer membrane protein assembly factor BamB precursor [Deltaproteobacteria bacterium ADurb.Bin058]HHW97298.1 PQQ-binding-like beta-propeller repeat protein [Oligoflexales bacterium]HQC43688.1 PQQ-binding-like beta-propeller repeat protein [Myxococcota bacterium]
MKHNLPILLLFLSIPLASVAQQPTSSRSAPSPTAILGQFSMSWGHKVYDNEMFALSPTDTGECAVDGSKGIVYCGVKTGSIFALAIDTGRILWEYKTGGSITGRPAVGPLGVYVGSSDGCLYYLNFETGISVWTSPYCTDIPIRGEVTVFEGQVIFAVATNKIYSVKADDGTFKWAYNRDRPSAMSAEGVASPVVAKGKVIAGFSDGYLVGVDLNNGKELWASDLGADLSGAVDVDATPVVVDDRVFTGAFAAGPTCLSIDDGSVIWTSKYFGISKVDYSNGNIFFGTSDGEVISLAADTGKLLWSAKLSTSSAYAPARIGRHLFVGGDQGIWAIDSFTGQPLVLLTVPFGVKNSPAVWQNMLFFVGGAGTVNAVNWINR